jgi:hypothetical protein
MDWKHKHFVGTRTYSQTRHQVLAEALRLMSETSRWTLEDTADGFKAQAAPNDFAHAATAAFHVVPDGDGALVTVEMAVKRFGLEGYMLFDVGGYYSGEIRNWLESIGDRLEGQVGAAAHRPRGAGERMWGCVITFTVVVFGLWWGWNLIVAPLIGITTGAFYWVGRGNGDDELHGAWARGVSAAILALDVLLFFYVRRWYRRILAPRTTERGEERPR